MRIWPFHCLAWRFRNPWLGTEILQVSEHRQNKTKIQQHLWASGKKSYIMRVLSVSEGQCLRVNFLNIHILILFLFLCQAFLEFWYLLCYTRYKNSKWKMSMVAMTQGVTSWGKSGWPFPWGPWHTQNLLSLISPPIPILFLAAPLLAGS